MVKEPETPFATRRGFFTGAIYAIWAAMAAVFGAPALAYLFSAPKPRGDGDWTEAGDVSGLSAGQPVEITFYRNRSDGWKIVNEKNSAWIVKSQNGVTAFGARCTHLGCAYHWDGRKQQFVCPCHNSFFSIDGAVLGGPAPRPLDRYETKLQDGRLLIGRLRQTEERRS